METLEDLKYVRVGYVDQGRTSDHLLASMLRRLPGDGRLPLRWFHRSHTQFLEKYAHLGAVLWAGAINSHTLLINGFKIIRVWTDTPGHCQVDICDTLVTHLQGTKLNAIKDIPAGNVRKCKPFTKRVTVSQQFEVNVLMEAIERAYGVHLQTV